MGCLPVHLMDDVHGDAAKWQANPHDKNSEATTATMNWGVNLGFYQLLNHPKRSGSIYQKKADGRTLI